MRRTRAWRMEIRRALKRRLRRRRLLLLMIGQFLIAASCIRGGLYFRVNVFAPLNLTDWFLYYFLHFPVLLFISFLVIIPFKLRSC